MPYSPAPLSARTRRPRILAVGFHRLRRLLHELAPEYGDTADVEVLESRFDAAVAEIEQRQRRQPLDVVVAAGSNAAYLRQRIDLPVVQVRVGGLDYLRALARARGLSPRIALVTFGDTPPELRQFDQLFGLQVALRHYRGEEEARDVVQQLKAEGVAVVVAPGLVVDLAEEAGLTGLLLYSTDAVRQALDDAVEVARAARIESARRERLATILGQLHDGVVAVDTDERIQTLNPAMEALLDRPASELLGQRLGDVAPELSLSATLRHGRAEQDGIQRFGSRQLITSRMPILEDGALAGAVLTCRDATVIQRVERRLRGQQPRGPASARHRLASLVGPSTGLRRVVALAEQFARSDATVLIVGESGTGKELLAQGLHAASARARRPFVALNCGALPETLLESELFGHEEGAFTGARKGGKPGLVEAAHTGTLFLDEIGEMPVALQSRLLRVLQEREVLRIGAVEPLPVDLRVVAATHRDLAERVEAGQFRRDLYYRLNILRLVLPPLRERPEDLPALAEHLLQRVAERLRVSAEPARARVQALLARARHHGWPGNVRELENLIERLVSCAPAGSEADEARLLQLMAPELFSTSPAAGPAAAAFSSVGRAAERDRIRAVLAECGGNRQAASQRLGIARSTLWRKLQED